MHGPERPFPSVTIEGAARVVREGLGEPTARIVGRILGAEPPPRQDDATLHAVGRVILELDVDGVYGASYLEGGG